HTYDSPLHQEMVPWADTLGKLMDVLNPLINPLACISYGMFYIAYKLLFVQVMDQPDAAETAGLYFPMAVSNL
ncbi:hypothetical protein MPER_00779, partial [Moniliophthora perniciosa FA553]